MPLTWYVDSQSSRLTQTQPSEAPHYASPSSGVFVPEFLPSRKLSGSVYATAVSRLDHHKGSQHITRFVYQRTSPAHATLTEGYISWISTHVTRVTFYYQGTRLLPWLAAALIKADAHPTPPPTHSAKWNERPCKNYVFAY
ncbi:hypothetical protein J3458_004788 [Metarhizium acridum]|uniref:uncharacterized protein n=1 Tax=Metarhizium acridum TaxID=92637 RepID=UPI001C6BBC5F|nr:hypothetical protein J3458_004788 [Metarhizium acridum]